MNVTYLVLLMSIFGFAVLFLVVSIGRAYRKKEVSSARRYKIQTGFIGKKV